MIKITKKIKFIICRTIQTKFNLYSILIFCKEYALFKKLHIKLNRDLPINLFDIYPYLNDKTNTIGVDYHYVYHTAWASRILAKTRPDYHIDISSYLYFSTLVSAFIPVKFYDFRPAKLLLSNLSSESIDLLQLPFENNSIISLSCMHVIEHIGLGRYKDPIDPNGDLKAIKELIRVLAANGSLLFVVPIGKPKVMFNGHRIYSYEQIINYFSELYLEEFALIPDQSEELGILLNAKLDFVDQQNYGCGCFWFKKI